MLSLLTVASGCKRKGPTGPIIYDKAVDALRWAPISAKPGTKKSLQESALMPVRSAKAPKALHEGLILEAHKRGIWLNAHYAYFGRVSPKNKKAFDASMARRLKEPQASRRRSKVIEVIEGRVDPSLKKDRMASSYLILPVFERLKEAATEQQKYARIYKELKFTGRLTLLLDKTVPFRLLSEVMYTAGQADFGKFDLAVCASSSPPGKCTLRYFPLTPPTFTSKSSSSGLALKSVIAGGLGLKGVIAGGPDETGTKKPQGRKAAPPKAARRPHPKPKSYPVQRGPANFTSSISRNGTTLIVRGDRLPQGCDWSKMPPSSAKHKAPTFPATSKTLYKDLAACYARVRKNYPDATAIIYMAEPEIPISTIVRHLEANIKDGKPLFRRTVLSAGVL